MDRDGQRPWLLLLGLLVVLTCGCTSLREVKPETLLVAYPPLGQDWPQLLEEKQVQSVVHLDGFAPDREDYRQLRSAADARRLAFHDIYLSQTRIDHAEVNHLLDVLHDAPKPLLIAGRTVDDRVGFAVGLYLVAVEGRPREEALRELGWTSLARSIGKPNRYREILANWTSEEDFMRAVESAELASRDTGRPTEVVLGKPVVEGPPPEVVPTPALAWETLPARTWTWLFTPPRGAAFELAGAWQESRVVRNYAILDPPTMATTFASPLLLVRSKPTLEPTSTR